MVEPREGIICRTENHGVKTVDDVRESAHMIMMVMGEEHSGDLEASIFESVVDRAAVAGIDDRHTWASFAFEDPHVIVRKHLDRTDMKHCAMLTGIPTTVKYRRFLPRGGRENIWEWTPAI
jgi:hypothetical protein